MDWHFTWQDPVAIGLAVLFLGFAFWLSKRVERAGCASCPSKQSAAPTQPAATAKIVRLERLRLSRRGAASRTE